MPSLSKKNRLEGGDGPSVEPQFTQLADRPTEIISMSLLNALFIIFGRVASRTVYWTVFLLSCAGYAQAETEFHLTTQAFPARCEFDATAKTLHNWLVVGPFTETSSQDPWNFNYLAQSGIQETDFYARSFDKYTESLPQGEPGRHVDTPHRFVLNQGDFIDFFNLFDLPHVTDLSPGAVYAACEVTCLADNSAVLLVGGADAEKVWLNGSLLYGTLTRRGMNTYDEAIPITLKKGANFLLLKVAHWKLAWGLTARIEPTAEAAAATALQQQGMLNGLILKRCIMPPDAVLDIMPRGVPQGIKFLATIVEPSGKSVAKTTVTAGRADEAPHLLINPGIYRLILECGDKHYSEPFIVGDPLNLVPALETRCNVFAKNDRIKLNLDALQRRIAILCQPENRSRHDYALDRSLVYSFEELEKALLLLENKQEAFSNIPGLHIRAFRSRIDDQPQYYRLFVPSSYRRDGGRLPVAVMLPTIISASRPFIESAFIAAHSEAERMSVIAERLGIAVLWSGYRNKPTGQPCEFTHFDEVLAAVGNDYNIDSQKISLYGACSGGAIASMLAVRWPGRFSGIGLLNPVFTLPKSLNADDITLFSDFPGFKSWLRPTIIREFLAHENTPTFIIHDGAEPGHGSLAVSVNFAEHASAAGYPLKFDQRMQTLAQHFGAWEELLTWLATQERKPALNPIGSASSANPPALGSIADAFADRFLVVIGTGGDGNDRAAIQRICDDVQNSWKSSQFGTCRVCKDNDFDEKEEIDSNLILVGNEITNSVWRKLGGNLALMAEEDKIQIKQRVWTGRKLSAEMVLANPLNPKHQIVLIGSKNLADAHFGSLNLSIEGWFSYAIWSNTEGTPALVDAGTWSAPPEIDNEMRPPGYRERKPKREDDE